MSTTQKKNRHLQRFLSLQFGRGGEIRTHGLLYPKQARYQAAPRPDIFTDICISATYYIIKQKWSFVNNFLPHFRKQLYIPLG